METENRISYLLKRYLENSSTKEELNELFKYVDEDSVKLENLLLQSLQQDVIDENPDQSELDSIFTAVEQHIEEEVKLVDKKVFKRLISWKRVISIAAILLIISVSGYYFLANNQTENNPLSKQASVSPGGNKATLSLESGEIISLEEIENGVIINRPGMLIEKTSEGELTYSPVNDSAQLFAMNTLKTPKGGQYHLSLPDGSKVWLNSESSLEFPTSFVGKERSVILKGEAYFEIKRNEEKPFIIQTDDSKVEVLGTKFNIRAYADEELNTTTLKEGSLLVNASNGNVLLVPGQEALISKTGSEKLKVRTADVDQALAWKDGVFVFEETPLSEIMQQINRWYNTEVIYYKMPETRFTGVMPRNEDIQKLLRMIEKTSDVRFTIKGNKIYVNDLKEIAYDKK